uniref:hypothetical protein n=1 Tax=Saccharothrix espanaensis TaxID=103731 RepID=UPI003F490D76
MPLDQVREFFRFAHRRELRPLQVLDRHRVQELALTGETIHHERGDVLDPGESRRGKALVAVERDQSWVRWPLRAQGGD